MEVQETTQGKIESINNSPLEVQDLNMKADSSLCEQKQFVSSQQKNNANVENNVEYPDLSSTFTTDRVFETRSDLIQWAQKVGLTCGTVVVVSKSENATPDGTRRLYLACERSGIYRDHRKKKEIDNKEKVDKQEGKMKKPRRTGTKKTNCPFRLKGVFVRGSEDKWKVEVQCARHNHSLAISFEGHSFVGRLRPEQEKLVFDLMKTGVAPKHALNVIKDRDPNNSSTIRHIYNAKQKQRKLEKGDRTELQQLLHLLHNNGYVEVSRCEEGSIVIRNLFWAHPESIKLTKCFPKVFIMDPTYKTNKYRWPLLEIVGVTSTMKTFSICFALMEHETEDDFTWALRCLQVLLGDNISPDVIVTDRDYALMNAAAVIFPTAVKLLCRWHISKDILAKGKREIRDWHSSTDVQATEEKEAQEKDMAETLCDKWAKVVLATTEAEYIHQLKELEKEFQRWPKFIHYLHQTWLKHKERFIAAWTDQHMHFGNTSTNRVEGAHSLLKRALTSSKYDFLGMWHMIHPSLTVQITEIRASFERSLIYVKHDHDILCFQNIRGFVSINALDLIVGEMKRCSYVGMDNHICGCSLRRTHGLPCAHELNIIGLQGDKIHLEEINDFWKKLSITVVDVDLSDLGARPEFLALIDRYKNSTTDQQILMLKQMLELGNPQCSGLLQPLAKTKTKGRPFGWRKELPKVDNSTKREPSAFELEIHEFNSSQSAKSTAPAKKKLKVTKSTTPPNKKMDVQKTHQSLNIVSILKFPEFFRPFIIDANNVDGDGNCGFRAVAACMEMEDENGWLMVRSDLTGELLYFREEYNKVFGGKEQVDTLLDILDTYDSPCPPKNWFLLPYMGYLVASTYHHVLVSISPEACLTFVPLRSAPPSKKQKVLAIGLVDGNHFVPLKLKAGCPIPEPVAFWKKFHHREADKWEKLLQRRNRAFKEIVGSNIQTQEGSYDQPIILE